MTKNGGRNKFRAFSENGSEDPLGVEGVKMCSGTDWSVGLRGGRHCTRVHPAGDGFSLV